MQARTAAQSIRCASRLPALASAISEGATALGELNVASRYPSLTLAPNRRAAARIAYQASRDPAYFQCASDRAQNVL